MVGTPFSHAIQSKEVTIKNATTFKMVRLFIALWFRATLPVLDWQGKLKLALAVAIQ